MLCRRSVTGVRGLQNQWSLVVLRYASSMNAKPELIDKNLSFRPAFDSKIDEEQRPVVLLYSWLEAKARHIFKYGDFYLGKGFDVLHIKVEPIQLIRPVRAQAVVQQVLDFVNDRKPFDAQSVLVHGFSVGGYLYGETIVKMLTEQEKYGAIGKKVVGQIFDSPVDFEGIPRGFSRAVTPSKPVQLTIQSLMELYLKLTKKHTVEHYVRSSSFFHANDLRIPTMFLYSRDDPIGIPEPIEAVARRFQERGIPTFLKAWDSSAHVSHFHHHPVEYIRMLNMFLEKIGLLNLEQSAPVEMSQ